jgi:AraC-like DNA-binding protein
MENPRIINLPMPSANESEKIKIVRILEEHGTADTVSIQYPDFSGLCINLASRLRITLADTILDIKPRHYQLLHVAEGQAAVTFPAGKRSILLINMPYAFISQFKERYPNEVQEYARAAQQKKHYTVSIEPRPISREMETTINLLCNFQTVSKELENQFLYQMIVSLILRHLGTTELSAEKKKIDTYVEIAQHLLTSEYRKAWTVDLLADTLGIHKKTLTSKFKRAFKVSPIKYLQNVRLDKARELLIRSASITQVAKHIGYKYTNDFTRAFQKKFGYPPIKVKQENFPNS